jgi:membrane associated rhomboid family serine protease
LIPGCYANLDPVCELRESWAGWVSPVAHAFLHGDWTHFATNAVWLLAFGTPVARRLGVSRFLLFCAAGALAGAGLFYLLNASLIQPMIGASGVVSALMGGAARFALGSMGRLSSGEVAHAPLLGIGASLSDRTILFFILIFFGTNLLLGSGGAVIFGEGGAIAWEAHVGGFLFGFLCFAFFDPRRQRPIEAL